MIAEFLVGGVTGENVTCNV